MDQYLSELLPRTSKSYLTLAHQIFGFHQRNANCQILHAVSILVFGKNILFYENNDATVSEFITL